MSREAKKREAAGFAALHLEAVADEVRAIRRQCDGHEAEELERLESLCRIWCGRLEQMAKEETKGKAP